LAGGWARKMLGTSSQLAPSRKNCLMDDITQHAGKRNSVAPNFLGRGNAEIQINIPGRNFAAGKFQLLRGRALS
jgi:hypothetical protein